MNWSLLSVELVVGASILALLVAELAAPAHRRASLWAVALGGVGLAALVLSEQRPPGAAVTFQGMFVLDRFAAYFKWLFLATTAVVILMTRAFGQRLGAQEGAFFMLLLTALLGTLVLASVDDLLMLFLGLELLTFSLYIMSAYLTTDPRSAEAGLKYLVLGSVSSGFLVFGIALLYGFAGATGFSAIAQALRQSEPSLAAQAGVLLVLAALGFKVAAVPFHLWVPDVYEGAPTPVVAMLSVGSKMAGIVVLLRLLGGLFQPLAPLWTDLVAAASCATMLYGNLAAIPQTNIKRLLGYSSIGHAGYLLMGLATGTVGEQAVGYYLLAYLLSNLAVFFVVAAASEALGGDELDRYRGLSQRSPVLAAAMFLGLLSLAGVPPLAGFVGKLLVLLATAQAGRLWLVAVGAVNVAISLYYYLMVVKRMYLEAPDSAAPIRAGGLSLLTLAVLCLGILAAGIWQEPFLEPLTAALRP